LKLFEKVHLHLDICLAEVNSVCLLLSGGADSVFLLHALHAWSKRWNRPLTTLHVNYRLRSIDSDQDALFVQQLCKDLEVACEVHRVPDAFFSSGNLQAKARGIRRVCAQERACPGRAFLTAHHAGDQAENLICGLLSGRFPFGVSLMRAQDGHWFHPLLETDPFEMREALRSRGLTWREDRSNASSLYQRNALRHTLLAPLRAHAPSELPALLQSMTDALMLLQDRRKRDLAQALKTLDYNEGPQGLSFDRQGLNRYFSWMHLALVEEMGRRCGAWFRLPRLAFRERLAKDLLTGRPGSSVSLGQGYVMSLGRKRAFWHTEALSTPKEQRLELGESVCFADQRFALSEVLAEESKGEFHRLHALRTHDKLALRVWRQGDRIQIGRDQHAKLSEIFSAAGLAGPQKETWPVFTLNDEPIWLPGLRHAWSETKQNKTILIIRKNP
jgi:tRNA(Ile)-lysidine synthase